MSLFNYSKWLPRIGEKLISAKYVLYITVPIWLFLNVCYVALSNPESWNTSESDLPGSVAEQAVVIAVMLTVILPLATVQAGIMMLIATKWIKVSPYSMNPSLAPMISALRIEKNIPLTKPQTTCYYLFCAAMLVTYLVLFYVKTPPQ